jgi:hypothetical protein
LLGRRLPGDLRERPAPVGRRCCAHARSAALSGVSKQAIATAAKFLEARGYATIGPESPGSRLKALTLTPKGRTARDSYEHRVRMTEQRWRDHFGADTMSRLHERLQALPPLDGVEPPPTAGVHASPDPTRSRTSR